MKEKKNKIAILLLLLLLVLGAAACIYLGVTKKDETGQNMPTKQEAEEQPSKQESQAEKDDGIYKVKVLKSAHGSVTVNKTEAAEGEEIVLKVKADKGYEIKSLTVNKKKSETTFKMPAEDVRVLAKFSLVVGKGDFFGKSGKFESSDVINFNTDKGRTPYLKMDAKKGSPLYAYVNDLNAKQFFFETDVKVTDILKSEKYPKFGIMTNDGSEMVKFYLDMNTKKQVSSVGAVHQPNGKDDDWDNQDSFLLDEKLKLSKDTVKLGFLRNGNAYYFYVNGEVVAAGSNLSAKTSATGVFSFGTSLKLTNYKLVKAGDSFNELLEKAEADAKKFNAFKLTTNYFKETEDGVYTLKTNSDDEGKVDDVKYAGQILKTAYYSIKGTLTLKNSKDWSQARVLVSSDPKNEYVFAVEQTEKNRYQIFTMSKNNEDTWNNWTSIVDAEVNKNRKSIDFEVIVNGKNIYFLLDDMIVYTSESVSMRESTVKFAGYKNATTVVKNLDGYIFNTPKDVENYLKTKREKDFGGENFGVTVGDGTTYITSDGINLEKDRGEAPTIELYKGAPRYAYLNDTFTDKAYFETRVNISKVLNNDEYPKFGIIFNGKTESLKFFVDMNAEMNASAVGVVHQPTDGDDDWANVNTANVADMKFTGNDTVKLAVARDGKAYYFYVNDELVLVEDYGFTDEKTAVGIFSFNAVLTASDYKICTDSEADSYITQAEKDARFALSTYHFAETQDGVFTLTTSSNDESKVDNIERVGKTVSEAYYSVKGNISLTDAGDRGQARILISADPRNEYVIALERTNTGKYQIFTMSKANEDGWNNWTAIIDPEVNGNKNSIDFEVIADGNKVYFLIDDMIYYTSERVSMDESAVKFSSYGNATTTVKNIEGYIFETQEDVQDYLETKTVKEFKGENFGETVGDGVTYITTDGINLETDKGENPTIDIYKAAPRYAYLNNSYTNKFYFEAQVNVREVLNNDPYPKFGLMFNGRTEMVKYFVDMNPQMEASHVGVVHQKTGENDDWGNSINTAVPGMKFKGSDKVKLALVRDGRDYYFYVNDVLVLSRKNMLYNEKGAVGIFSFNAVMTASNYEFYEGDNANEFIAAAKAAVRANFFGAANGLTTTPGVDLSKDTGATTGTVTVNTGDLKFMYARDFYQENYYFETKVHVNQVYNDDPYPKFGILVQDGGVQELFFVDMTPDKTSSKVGVVHDGNWDGSVSANVSGMKFSGEGEYVTLGLLKQGGTFKFYVNGNQALTYNSSFTGKTTVGVFGFNTGMTLKEYYVEKR